MRICLHLTCDCPFGHGMQLNLTICAIMLNSVFQFTAAVCAFLLFTSLWNILYLYCISVQAKVKGVTTLGNVTTSTVKSWFLLEVMLSYIYCISYRPQCIHSQVLVCFLHSPNQTKQIWLWCIVVSYCYAWPDACSSGHFLFLLILMVGTSIALATVAICAIYMSYTCCDECIYA